jgi:hypothetical protein
MRGLQVQAAARLPTSPTGSRRGEQRIVRQSVRECNNGACGSPVLDNR